MSEPLIRRINREQMCWRAVDVEQLIEQDHVARTIWDLVGRLDLEGSTRALSAAKKPALQWLNGCEAVNYHTLASFRVEHRAELDELFTQVLGLMSAEGRSSGI